MNDFFKKIFKSVFGLDDAAIEKLFAENADASVLEAMIPEISAANRTKWETALLADTKFTEPLTARGHSAGQAKAYQAIKDDVLKSLGLQIAAESDDYKDNVKFSAKIKEHLDSQKKTASGGADNEAIIAKLKADFEAEKNGAIEKERGVLNGQFAQTLKSLKETHILDNALMSHGVNVKIKGGLPLADLMPAIKAKTGAYKFEFDTEKGGISKVLGLDGHELDNQTKDGKLSPAEIISKIFEPFVDTAKADDEQQGNGSGSQGSGGNGQRQGDGGGTKLTGLLSEMQSMR